MPLPVLMIIEIMSETAPVQQEYEACGRIPFVVKGIARSEVLWIEVMIIMIAFPIRHHRDQQILSGTDGWIVGPVPKGVRETVHRELGIETEYHADHGEPEAVPEVPPQKRQKKDDRLHGDGEPGVMPVLEVNDGMIIDMMQILLLDQFFFFSCPFPIDPAEMRIEKGIAIRKMRIPACIRVPMMDLVGLDPIPGGGGDAHQHAEIVEYIHTGMDLVRLMRVEAMLPGRHRQGKPQCEDQGKEYAHRLGSTDHENTNPRQDMNQDKKG
jgi:hypothetical protein